MRLIERFFLGFLIIGLSWCSPVLAGSPTKKITENACARLKDAEIVWHLSEYRWLCCIPKNEEEYETCVPITDMKPLPKTSLKTFPPNTTKTIKPENQKK